MQAVKIAAIAVLMLIITAPVYADVIGSQTLIEQGRYYDNKIVEYKGEVIGDVMYRGDYAWINVNDGSNAMGIWVPGTEAKKINYSGQYKYKGDIVLVNGLFHRACSQHGGDMDIHASKLEIVEEGYKRDIPFNYAKSIWALALSVVALFLYMIAKYKKIL